VARHIRSRIKF